MICHALNYKLRRPMFVCLSLHCPPELFVKDTSKETGVELCRLSAKPMLPRCIETNACKEASQKRGKIRNELYYLTSKFNVKLWCGVTLLGMVQCISKNRSYQCSPQYYIQPWTSPSTWCVKFKKWSHFWSIYAGQWSSMMCSRIGHILKAHMIGTAL